MSESIVAIGDKLHIMTRRLFEEEIRRHFAGEVMATSGALVELRGFAFVFNPASNQYRKLPEIRTYLCSLGDSGHICNKLPRELALDRLSYQVVDQRLVVTDGKEFILSINEFGPKH